jgi:hypothetical protein
MERGVLYGVRVLSDTQSVVKGKQAKHKRLKLGGGQAYDRSSV